MKVALITQIGANNGQEMVISIGDMQQKPWDQ